MQPNTTPTRLSFGLAALLTALLMMSTATNAGSRGPYICWTGLNGATDCAALPRSYHLPGVRRPSGRGKVTVFQLTRSQIAALSRYIDVENIRPAYTATLYPPKRGAHRRRVAVRSFRRRVAVRGVRRRVAVRSVRQRAPQVATFRRRNRATRRFERRRLSLFAPRRISRRRR